MVFSRFVARESRATLERRKPGAAVPDSVDRHCDATCTSHESIMEASRPTARLHEERSLMRCATTTTLNWSL